MNNNKHKTRRQFLRNTSMAALSIGILPTVVTGNSTNKNSVKTLAMCDKTTEDYYGEGPFYSPNPPLISNAKLADDNEKGERMIISGRVFNLECSQYIPIAEVDVWHANEKGEYDNDAFNLRGKMLTNAQGFYMYETVKPGKYLDGDEFRPSHIHYKITPPGFDTLTTQLYFEGDPDLGRDPASSMRGGEFDATHRIISLNPNADNVLEGTFDVVINGDGVITSLNNIHVDKGMIYKISPNPFADELVINYGVFKKSKVSLLVFDMGGQMVATLEERTLSSEKYEAVWQPKNDLPKGHYFIVLKINDLQVHYLKVTRQ